MLVGYASSDDEKEEDENKVITGAHLLAEASGTVTKKSKKKKKKKKKIKPKEKIKLPDAASVLNGAKVPAFMLIKEKLEKERKEELGMTLLLIVISILCYGFDYKIIVFNCYFSYL